MSTPRSGELTFTDSRHLFDLCPDLVTSTAGRERWMEFTERYNQCTETPENESNFPLQLDFELNAACNLRCQFCLHGQETVKERRLPWEVYEAAILEGERNGLVSIKLNYINEPLLVSNIDEYIIFARAHGVLNTYMATNGTLLTEAMGGRLLDAGLTKIMVSIDAATSETYLKMRGSKKYDLVVENIRRFIALRDSRGLRFPLVRVNFLRTDENIHEEEAFRELWTGVADMVGYQQQVAVPDSEVETMVRPSGGWGCSFPAKLMVVDRDGLVLPCCTFSGREMPVGTYMEDSDSTIWDAWNSSEMVSLRDMHRRGAYRESKICRHCVEGVETSEGLVQLNVKS